MLSRAWPSSGKTVTTVNLHKERDYTTTFEQARHYIDAGKAINNFPNSTNKKWKKV